MLAPKRAQSMLTRSPRAGYITPGTSTVAKFKTKHFCDLLDYRPSQTQRQVNAFIMSGLYSPPTARFVLLCHLLTPPYSARRRLPYLYITKELV